MLSLTRSAGEEILVICPDGTPITIQLSEIRSKRARVRIGAPREFRIVRGEMLQEEEAAGRPLAIVPALTPIPEF